jgi:hypothetical protein
MFYKMPGMSLIYIAGTSFRLPLLLKITLNIFYGNIVQVCSKSNTTGATSGAGTA